MALLLTVMRWTVVVRMMSAASHQSRGGNQKELKNLHLRSWVSRRVTELDAA